MEKQNGRIEWKKRINRTKEQNGRREWKEENARKRMEEVNKQNEMIE